MHEQHLEDPLWDEGLSGMLYGEYERKEQPFAMDQLRELGVEHAVRIDDILETLFLMAIYGAWQYVDETGAELPLDENALNELYAKDRLNDSDLEAFPGLWQPTQ